MSKQRDREEFLVTASKEGIPLETARKLLRHAATLDRLAVAMCNGDWPADNGERKVVECPKCESLWVKSSFRKGMCPDCRTQELVQSICEPLKITPVFGGDPRGCVLKLKVPSGKTNDWSREVICVPS